MGDASANHAYPRPQLVRENWMSLNGRWDFAIDAQGAWGEPGEVVFDRTIVVPFAPETAASGVHGTGFYRGVWYRRNFPPTELKEGERLLLHFGAVDWNAKVWVNGRFAVEHDGGYTPFEVDVTGLIDPSGENEIVVRAFDDPLDLAKPRGKQDWAEEAHSIWYWRTTGIWQTVWMEKVSDPFIAKLRWTADIQKWGFWMAAEIGGEMREGMRLAVRLSHKGKEIADDVYGVTVGPVKRWIGLLDPGIDDHRHDLLWAPNHPNLVAAQIELLGEDGEVIDRVESYTAMRGVCCQGDRFVINTRPYPLRMVLDQGYWPETGLTAPDDEALRKDVELVKAMGFNGVRMHQKVEDPRFLYWCDVLGLLVWEEMPSPYTFSNLAVERLTNTWMEVLERDYSHPCIVALVPFNESWGVPDLPDVAAQRNFVKSIYYLTKALDPTRPVVGNDGWESVVTDIIAIHDYDADPVSIAQRYTTSHKDFAEHFSERPGHRIVILERANHDNLPIMLTEFGGIAFSRERGTWGYSRAKSADDFASKYAELLEAVRSLPLLAGFCYTQFTDTYQEANGLLYMDRTPKFPIEEIAIATRGAGTDDERRLENKWRQRLLNLQRKRAKGAEEVGKE
jgi:hypothetical protein